MASSGNDNMEVDGEATPQHQQQGTASSGSNPSQQQGTPSSGSNPSQQQDTRLRAPIRPSSRAPRLRAPLLLGQAESGNKRTARPTELQHQPLQRSRRSGQSPVPRFQPLQSACRTHWCCGRNVVAFLRSAKTMSSQTAMDAARIGEHHLRTMFGALANAGLPSFTPDVFGNPESLYNIAHELVALHSFRIVATNYGYSVPYAVNLAIAKDDHLIQRFYRSFIYGYMKIREDSPATNAHGLLQNPSVAALVGNQESHSDDEELPDRTGYRVHKKPRRDSAVTALFKVLDSRHDDHMTRKRRKGSWKPRTRQRGFSPTNLSCALPPDVPIDYFSPEFFNDLSAQERASYRNNGIALLTQEYCQTWADIQQWRKLETTAFMTKYGAAKLALYDLPTPDELDMLDSMDMD
ncbi:hypothetical protein B0H14DRAFT_2641158 [Mycena olivaceomarginata]|nr:hypothetical protein B0H14DRAFT_2641158 [Mycena olivaceomarginata]